MALKYRDLNNKKENKKQTNNKYICNIAILSNKVTNIQTNTIPINSNFKFKSYA